MMAYEWRCSASHQTLAFVFGLLILCLSSAYASVDWETFTPELNDTLVIESDLGMFGRGLSIAIFKHPSKREDSQVLPGLAFGIGRDLWTLPPELMTKLEEAVAGMRTLDGMHWVISQNYSCPITTYIDMPIGYLRDERSIEHLLHDSRVLPYAGILHISYGGEQSDRTFIEESARGVADREIEALPDALKKYEALRGRAYGSRNAESEIPLTQHTKKRIHDAIQAMVQSSFHDKFKGESNWPKWWRPPGHDEL